MINDIQKTTTDNVNIETIIEELREIADTFETPVSISMNEQFFNYLSKYIKTKAPIDLKHSLSNIDIIIDNTVDTYEFNMR